MITLPMMDMKASFAPDRAKAKPGPSVIDPAPRLAKRA